MVVVGIQALNAMMVGTLAAETCAMSATWTMQSTEGGTMWRIVMCRIHPAARSIMFGM
jgi:hypothetical protein